MRLSTLPALPTSAAAYSHIERHMSGLPKSRKAIFGAKSTRPSAARYPFSRQLTRPSRGRTTSSPKSTRHSLRHLDRNLEEAVEGVGGIDPFRFAQTLLAVDLSATFFAMPCAQYVQRHTAEKDGGHDDIRAKYSPHQPQPRILAACAPLSMDFTYGCSYVARTHACRLRRRPEIVFRSIMSLESLAAPLDHLL